MREQTKWERIVNDFLNFQIFLCFLKVFLTLLSLFDDSSYSIRSTVAKSITIHAINFQTTFKSREARHFLAFPCQKLNEPKSKYFEDPFEGLFKVFNGWRKGSK